MGRSINQRSYELFSISAEQLTALIRDLEQVRNNLTADIDAEEKRSGLSDPSHFAYPPLAAANRARRDRIDQSIDGLRQKLSDVTQQLSDSRPPGFASVSPREIQPSP